MRHSISRQDLVILLLVGTVAVLFILALVGVITYRVVEEQRAAASRITRIVPETNGYRVYWAGGDSATAVTAYDVQVCQLPCRGWRDWQMHTAETSAWFGPDEGKHFGFRVRSHYDNATVEPWPTSASMTTRQARAD